MKNFKPLSSKWYCVANPKSKKIIEKEGKHYFRDISEAQKLKKKQDNSRELEIFIIQRPENLD